MKYVCITSCPNLTPVSSKNAFGAANTLNDIGLDGWGGDTTQSTNWKDFLGTPLIRSGISPPRPKAKLKRPSSLQASSRIGLDILGYICRVGYGKLKHFPQRSRESVQLIIHNKWQLRPIYISYPPFCFPFLTPSEIEYKWRDGQLLSGKSPFFRQKTPFFRQKIAADRFAQYEIRPEIAPNSPGFAVYSPRNRCKFAQ